MVEGESGVQGHGRNVAPGSQRRSTYSAGMASASESNLRIAWLRGINVGGHRKIKMADLRSLLDGLGATSVSTYIQSGNVVFTPSGDLPNAPAALEDELTGAIAERFGFDVPVMVRTVSEVEAARDAINERFADVLSRDDEAAKMVHVQFLSDVPTQEAIDALDPARSPNDTYVVVGQTLHVHYGNGVARTKLTPDWVEKTLGVSATGRNLRTLEAVLALAEKL